MGTSTHSAKKKNLRQHRFNLLDPPQNSWCPLSPQAVGLLWWWFHFKLVTCSSIKAQGTSDVGCALGGRHTTICWLFLTSLELVVSLRLPQWLEGLGFRVPSSVAFVYLALPPHRGRRVYRVHNNAEFHLVPSFECCELTVTLVFEFHFFRNFMNHFLFWLVANLNLS